MTYSEHQGDLFSSTAEALGHGVNCKGLMGAGIAVAFRSAYPDMYSEYRRLCVEGLLNPGDIYPYKAHDRTVINIASQQYPGPDANIVWLLQGVIGAMAYCSERGLKSLALPRIGCGIGGLNWADVKSSLELIADQYPEVNLEVWTL